MARRKYSKKSRGATNSKISETPTSQQTTESKSDEKPSATESGKDIKESTHNSYNDPEWYAKDAALVVGACNIPFSSPLGDPLEIIAPNTSITQEATPSTTKATLTGDTVPGICTLKLKSSFGKSSLITDPLNVAAQALYTYVRHATSGRKNYDPTDLMLYVTAMADVYSYIMWCTRIYNKAYIYSQRNKYIGSALLASENIDADDVVENLANFRYWINAFINKVSAYAVPAPIAYYQRRAWVFSHLYLENPDSNIKDQLYQFTPDGFFRFGLDSDGAGMLKYGTIGDLSGGGTLTVTKLRAIGENLMTEVYGNEDFGTMSGDIIKAFEGNIIGLMPIPEIGDIIPVYSEYVLLQFKNSRMVHSSRGSGRASYQQITGMDGNTKDLWTGEVQQDTSGRLLAVEGMASDSGADLNSKGLSALSNAYLTVNTPTPGPIDVMEITRLLPMCRGMQNSPKFFFFDCGADYPTQFICTRYNASGSLVNHTYDYNFVSSYNIATLRDMVAFKYCPMFYLYSTESAGKVVNSIELLAAVDNFTTVDAPTVARMHEVALLSMLFVPGVAKMTNSL